MKKITACLFILAILVLFPVTVWAQKTTLTTEVPSSHTLYMDITGSGTVIIDGISCTQTVDLQIKRGIAPQISVKPADDAVLKTAVLNEKDITEELRKGTYKMPQMCFDAKLTVVFEAVTGTPQTGDPIPVTALCFAMVLSLAGVLCCFLLPRKREM